MTTICWDGSTLAADSVSMCGLGLRRVVPKIFRLTNGWLFGGSGEYQEVLIVRDWLNGGEKPGKLDDFGGILVKGPKEYYRIENKCVLMPINDAFHACGSGRDFALAAMHLGKNAREAVEIAMVFDGWSGGEVDELRLAPATVVAEKFGDILAERRNAVTASQRAESNGIAR